MISTMRLTFSIFCYIAVVVLILFLISIFLTYKYKNRYRGFYAIFLGATKREMFIHVTNLLNFLILLYFLFNIKYFYTYGLYMIIFINLLSCTIAFKFHIIIMDVAYTIISSSLFLLLRLVNNYLLFVYYDNKISLLKIIFMIMIFIYILYISIRKMEVTMKSFKRLGRT